MADIEVFKGKLRTRIIGTTSVGIKWLQDNIDFHNRCYNSHVEVVVSIENDYHDEMLELLEGTGMEIDVK